MTPYYKRDMVLGGVRIIGVVVRDDHCSRNRVYRVEHLCCGDKANMSNEILKRRAHEKTQYCAQCGRKLGGKSTLKKTASEVVRVKQDSSFRIIEDIPIEERPKVPSAEFVIGLWERANARLIQRGRVQS